MACACWHVDSLGCPQFVEREERGISLLLCGGDSGALRKER